VDSLYSEQAERAVLGAVMIDAKAYERIDTVEADFGAEAHRAIWRAVTALRESGEPADPITVGDTVESHGADCGGYNYLGGILDEVVSAANVAAYARILRDLAVRRGVISAATHLQEAAGDRNRETSEVIDAAQREVLALSIKTRESRLAPLADYVSAFLDDLERRVEAEGGLMGVATGHDDVDRLIQGFEGGDLIVLAGRPSMGKTLLAEQWCEHIAAITGQPAAFFSLEMPANQLLRRSAARNARVPLAKLRDGSIEEHQWRPISEAVKRLRSVPLHIDDTPGLTFAELSARARRLHRDNALSVITVDYLQILQAGDLVSREARADQKVGEVASRLKALAKELDVPVVAVAQLNRQVDNRGQKEPQMSDLRESGQVEQDADVIAFVYREEVYDPETPKQGIADLIVRKQRNGPTGTVHLSFLGEYQAFESMAGEVPETKPAKCKAKNGPMDY